MKELSGTTKHPANPVIKGTSRAPLHSYPPSVIFVEDTYYAVVKSGGLLVGFSSDDGINWVERNSELLLPDENNRWDSTKLSYPLLRYDPKENKYVLFYSAHSEDKRFKTGYAYSQNPMNGYRRSRSNPIITPSSYYQYGGKTQPHSVQVSDIIVYNNKYIFYGTANKVENNTSISEIWVGEGTGWNNITDISVLKRGTDHEPVLQTPAVIQLEDHFLLKYTAGENKSKLMERRIEYVVGKTPYEFSEDTKILLEPGETGEWDERRVYASQWLKIQDGKYCSPKLIDGAVRLYYSGHDLGFDSASGPETRLIRYLNKKAFRLPIGRDRVRSMTTKWNRGLTGLAEFEITEREE